MQHIQPVFVKTSPVVNLNKLAGVPLRDGRRRPIDADNMLNDIIGWAARTRAFDQTDIHGDNRERYHIALHYVPEHGTSVVETFYLKDFLFPDRGIHDAHSFDDLMRMLDRDRLGEAMRSSLIDKFGLASDPDAPGFWRRDIRQCCHPDYSHLSPPLVAAAPVLAAA